MKRGKRTYAHHDIQPHYWADYLEDEGVVNAPFHLTGLNSSITTDGNGDNAPKASGSANVNLPYFSTSKKENMLSLRKDQGFSIYSSLFPVPGYSLMYNHTFWHDSKRPLGHNTDDNFATDYYNYFDLWDKQFNDWSEPSGLGLDIQYFKLNKAGDAYNDLSLRFYHYKKKIDINNYLRLNGGLNEASVNYTKDFILRQTPTKELTGNLGAGLGGVLTKPEMEGFSVDDWKNGIYEIPQKRGTFYEFHGFGGNIHGGMTGTFKLKWGLDLFLDLEFQLHYHHVNELTLIYKGETIFDQSGNILLEKDQMLYNRAYNAAGFAVIFSYGLLYRF